MSEDIARRIEALDGELRHPEEARRVAAARALGKLGVAAAVPSLMRAFRDIGYDARAPLIGIQDLAALPHFVEAARSSDEAMRYLGLEWLRGLRSDEARPQLEALLRDADDGLRCAAMAAYSALPTPPPPGPLFACLEDGSNDVRWNSVDALARLAERLPAQALLAQLGDARPRVRAVLARLLGKLHPREALPGLRGLAEDPHPKVRWWAQVALAEAGPSRLACHGALEGHVGFSAPPAGSQEF